MYRVNFTFNNRGFGLVETMVAAGLGLVVIYFLSQAMVSQAQQVSYLESRLSRNQFASELQLNYTNTEFCEKNFKGKNINSSKANGKLQLLDLNGKVLYDANDQSKNKIDGRIRIDSIYLENPTDSRVSSGGQGWVDLVVELSLPALARPLKSVRQPIFVTLTGNNVNTCNTNGKDSDEADCPSFINGEKNYEKVDPNCKCKRKSQFGPGECSRCQWAEIPFKNGTTKSELVSVTSAGGGDKDVNYRTFKCNNGSWTNMATTHSNYVPFGL